MNDKMLKPSRISHSEIASIAAEGVMRALAAREEHVRSLTDAELNEVSGGALKLSPAIIAGGIPPYILNAFNTNLTSPAINPAASLGALTMVG